MVTPDFRLSGWTSQEAKKLANWLGPIMIINREENDMKAGIVLAILVVIAAISANALVGALLSMADKF